MHKIKLKPGREASAKRFHPWIFSGAVQDIEENIPNGDPVAVYSAAGELLGTGHYHNGSIAVRLFSRIFEDAGPDLWKRKFEAALKLRKDVGLAGSGRTNAYRLVNAEGDGMPGLIVDYYNGTAVLQTHTAGMHRVKEQLAGALVSLMGDELKAVYHRGVKVQAGEAAAQGGKSAENGRAGNTPHGGHQAGYLHGSKTDSVISEHGNQFIVDWEGGQKTGFFLDQRENRRLLEDYSGGQRVLNLFGYTGGFSVYALRGGASEAVTVDSSAAAVKMAEQNVLLNFENDRRHSAVCADVFDFFKTGNGKYDLVVLDPPAFAKGMRAAGNALQAYRRVNAKAIERVAPGGMLFTFSCTQVISREQFRQAVYSAATLSGRDIVILHQLSQPADHPVSLYHPEGEYLKGLVLKVY
ncbi:MAG: class I SAM-dependent rRNA methyltransferase [Marinilabiliales bacterium]|nr:MAG: class I SAM-dependent rRNA methyltransferase [Marinilabiliales bacterium]